MLRAFKRCEESAVPDLDGVIFLGVRGHHRAPRQATRPTRKRFCSLKLSCDDVARLVPSWECLSLLPQDQAANAALEITAKDCKWRSKTATGWSAVDASQELLYLGRDVRLCSHRKTSIRCLTFFNMALSHFCSFQHGFRSVPDADGDHMTGMEVSSSMP